MYNPFFIDKKKKSKYNCVLYTTQRMLFFYGYKKFGQ